MAVQENNMVQINIIDREGNIHEVQAPTDMQLNVMELCIAAELPVEGTCGGIALCASCHCYIQTDHQLGSASEDEEDMLDQAFFVEENSRLCCQIPITKEIDGLTIKLAPV